MSKTFGINSLLWRWHFTRLDDLSMRKLCDYRRPQVKTGFISVPNLAIIHQEVFR